MEGKMTNKELILDSLVNGGDYGECETQIKEFFKFIGMDIIVDEIRKLINEMIDEGLISVNETWKNEHGEKPYAMTSKGKEAWNKTNLINGKKAMTPNN